MRQLLLAAAMSGAAIMAGIGPAAAQVAIETPAGGVYVGPAQDPYYYDYYDDYGPPGPRVYGYYYDRGRSVRARQRYIDRQACGRNAYLDGNVCLPGWRP